LWGRKWESVMFRCQGWSETNWLTAQIPVCFWGAPGGTRNPSGTSQKFRSPKKKTLQWSMRQLQPRQRKKKNQHNFPHTCTLKAFKIRAREIKLWGCTRGQLISLCLSLRYCLTRGGGGDGSSASAGLTQSSSATGHQRASVPVPAAPRSARTREPRDPGPRRPPTQSRNAYGCPAGQWRGVLRAVSRRTPALRRPAFTSFAAHANAKIKKLSSSCYLNFLTPHTSAVYI